MTFNSDQAGMAFFLLLCTLFNIWFVFTSGRRAFVRPKDEGNGPIRNLKFSVLVMALFDIPWVWLCAIQCLYNTFTPRDTFHQSYGEDSFGCRFMGWYSSFSMVSMMASNCLVAYYLLRYMKGTKDSKSFLDSTIGLMSLAGIILVAACLFASMPLIQEDGYLLTTGGFCYADFTNTTQSSIILALVIVLLLLSTVLWVQVGLRDYGYSYAIFLATWVLWIPACAFGIKNGDEIAYPYMLIGAIIGHGNALVNPILYGWHLFVKLGDKEQDHVKTLDEEQALKA